MIEIEKGIPMPERSKTGRKGKYPFSEMEVGDSFFLDDKTQKSVASTVTSARKKFGFTFAARDEDTGVRIWRTA